jgi:hypothetical protein
MLRRTGRAWDVLSAAVLAIGAGVWLSRSALTSVTTDLIAFFGIQAAVVLPAMIFTAGILRPEGLSLAEAKRYQSALRTQMKFWIVLLALDFLTVGSLIFGKAGGWRIAGTLPWVEWPVDLSRPFIAITVFVGALAILRTIPFVKGVLSLQSLNGELTEKAIKAKNRVLIAEQDQIAKETPFKPPEGYGRVVRRH